MTKPIASYRRIDRLKALAYELGFTSEDARQFGKLTKTATWEALLEPYFAATQALDIPLDNVLAVEAFDTPVSYSNIPVSYTEPRDTPVSYSNIPVSYTEPRDTPVSYSNIPVSYTEPRDTVLDRGNSTFLDWVDVGQLIAVVLASVGVFVLAMSLWRQINPLNLFPPVKVNIQIGTKL